MFDLTCRQAEEEWNKTGVWVLKTPVNKKDLCWRTYTMFDERLYFYNLYFYRFHLLEEEE